MNKTYIIIIVLFASLSLMAENLKVLQTSLQGKITTKNGEPIIGATLFFPELKTGTVTNTEGKYKLQNLPKSTMLCQISAAGYKMIADNIDLKTADNKDFVMEESVIEINEVVVTGQAGASQAIKMPTPISVVTLADLQQHGSTNIIDAIASQPGISQITTGSGISKPVIRGLGYNRVIVMKDGVRQEGQQWGADHGLEIDQFNVDRVEIIKGPGSLLYGSDAISGIINNISLILKCF